MDAHTRHSTGNASKDPFAPSAMIRTRSDGGVEEKKEEEDCASPSEGLPAARQKPSATEQDEDFDEQRDGFQAQVENVAKALFGTCAHAWNFLVQGESCARWPRRSSWARQSTPRRQTRPPLSIAEELQKLAAKEGQPFFTGGAGPRRADIPRFLGEEHVYSFEDDNISAISQHTLEEMARHGITFRRRGTDGGDTSVSEQSSDEQQLPPSPTRTMSASTSSSGKERRKRREEEKRRRTSGSGSKDNRKGSRSSKERQVSRSKSDYGFVA
jgi:hypothetical protein